MPKQPKKFVIVDFFPNSICPETFAFEDKEGLIEALEAYHQSLNQDYNEIQTFMEKRGHPAVSFRRLSLDHNGVQE